MNLPDRMSGPNLEIIYVGDNRPKTEAELAAAEYRRVSLGCKLGTHTTEDFDRARAASMRANLALPKPTRTEGDA